MAEPNLQKGSTDPAVRDLQQALKALGYDPGPIDGVFGTTTEAAVKGFQQARGITADGIVGNVTWINIDEADQSEPVLKIGSTGLPVRRAQKRMSLSAMKWPVLMDATATTRKPLSRSSSSSTGSPLTESLVCKLQSSTHWRTKDRELKHPLVAVLRHLKCTVTARESSR